MNTPAFLQRLLRRVVPPMDSGRSAERKAHNAIELCKALLSERGEVSGAALARDALDAYDALPADALTFYIDLLASEFSPDPAHIAQQAAAYAQNPTPQNLIALQRAVESPRQELFRRLNIAPGATAALVDMRRQLLGELRTHPQWAGVDADLAHLFRSWFNRGFLVLQRIDWRTSALVLERLIQYEAVHQIQGWDDLRRRLEKDRRCYAFFHPALPDEPLIFIEAALTQEIVGNVQPLLDPRAPIADPADARCAIFYSITNCQLGLRGVSFGNFLIKQVVEDLSGEFRRIRKFATLSPIPGFRAWLEAHRTFMSGELAAMELRDAASLANIPAPLKDEILRLCAYYLLRAKRGQAPLDSVARFHLANGARLARVNWLGDSSSAGIAASLGVTANYVYRIADVEANHEAYAKNFQVVTSSTVERLARDVKVPA